MIRELLRLDENDRPLPKFDISSKESSDDDFDRSRLASISSKIKKSKGRRIDFTSVSVKNTQTLVKTRQSSCSLCT